MDMYRFAFQFGLFLTFYILSHARHTVFISHSGEKTYLPSSSNANVCMTPTCVIAAADVLTSLDKTVDPCDDFYRFACGGWMKRQEISEDEPEMHIFVSTKNDLDRKLRDLLESKYKSSDPPFVKMLKDFYSTCVDVDTIKRQGSEPLKKMLRLLGGGWPAVEGSQWDESSFNWVDTLISFRKFGYDPKYMLDLYVRRDFENEGANIIVLEDPYPKDDFDDANVTLGLDDPKIVAYFQRVVKAAKLLGADESTAEKELLEALNFEMDFLKMLKKEAERNGTTKTIADLQKELPQVPWLKLINGLLLVEEVDENESFVDTRNGFLAEFADLITSTDKRVIANFMMSWAVLKSKDYLSEEWQEIKEEEKEEKSFEEKKGKVNRWEKCLKEVKANFEMGLSSYYVRDYFSDESKDEAMMLMKYIHKEFLKLLENNDWMDEETRKKAQDKANAIKSFIGYPKELLNDTFMMEMYKGLTINTDSYLESYLSVERWEKDERLSILRLNTNISHLSDEMGFSSKFARIIDVNAFYNPMENSIAIPAGILHDAFYENDRPNYMNFAEIGYVIGHEITHGFDNQGRNYDKDGKEVKWWDKVSDEHFLKKAKCIVDQYDNYTTFIGVKVNGELTQNENIADNGGLKEAYLAYQSWTKDHGIEPLLPGVDYTQDQMFWLSAAHVWCAKFDPERLKKMLVMDVHSPAKFRVIGPMSNLDEFSRDFKCSPDSPMNRKYKCEVW